jgi:Zn-dependent peptidase ImmA (M78 family)
MIDPLDAVAREVGSLARHHNPDCASWKAARRAILNAAEFLRAEAGEDHPPINPRIIARLRGVQAIEFFGADESPEALLIPTRGGFVIRLPTGRPQVRHRSSIAHEIGHTFFYDIRNGWPTRLLTRNSVGRLSHKEEDICRAFARALLVPAAQALEIKDTHPTAAGLELVSLLAKRFEVSEEFAAVRLMRDLDQLKYSVAIFQDRATSHAERSSERRYIGRGLRSLRKSEREVLDSLTDVLSKASSEQRHFLIEHAHRHRKLAEFRWNVSESATHCHTALLVDFPRQR